MDSMDYIKNNRKVFLTKWPSLWFNNNKTYFPNCTSGPSGKWNQKFRLQETTLKSTLKNKK